MLHSVNKLSISNDVVISIFKPHMTVNHHHKEFFRSMKLKKQISAFLTDLDKFRCSTNRKFSRTGFTYIFGIFSIPSIYKLCTYSELETKQNGNS